MSPYSESSSASYSSSLQQSLQLQVSLREEDDNTSCLQQPLQVSLREEDYDWGEEELTCNVCDRAFLTPWHLENHMIKRRHWGSVKKQSVYSHPV